MTSVREEILLAIDEVADGTIADQLTDESVLLESGLDSLGFAILVSNLEDRLGYDPFSLSETAFYPSTFGEFVAFYELHKPR